MLTGAGVPECTNFIETKAFDRLKTKTLADGNSDPILLLGPKGCGKTLSLVALLTILVNLGKPAQENWHIETVPNKQIIWPVCIRRAVHLRIQEQLMSGHQLYPN